MNENSREPAVGTNPTTSEQRGIGPIVRSWMTGENIKAFSALVAVLVAVGLFISWLISLQITPLRLSLEARLDKNDVHLEIIKTHLENINKSIEKLEENDEKQKELFWKIEARTTLLNEYFDNVFDGKTMELPVVPQISRPEDLYPMGGPDGSTVKGFDHFDQKTDIAAGLSTQLDEYVARYKRTYQSYVKSSNDPVFDPEQYQIECSRNLYAKPNGNLYYQVHCGVYSKAFTESDD